jgi:tetrapyrrole methylase family protein/MazG family protein
MPLALDSIFASLNIDPLAEGVQIVAAAQVKPPQPFVPLLPFSVTRPLLICGLDSVELAQSVQTALRAAYPAEHTVQLVSTGKVTPSAVQGMGVVHPAPDLCAYLPALPVLAAVRTFDALCEITARLRAPDGCPWDRQQTHESLRSFVLEETYEVLEALDSGNRQELCEELGDLMMQVMIHSQVAAEAGEFEIGDVLAGISSKLMRRHPHVFGDVQVSGAQEVLRNWQSIKQAEKKVSGANEPPPSLLGGVPVQLPALAYAQAMQERAGRIGFMQPAADLAQAIVAQVESLGAATGAEKEAIYGDVLFHLALLGRAMGVPAEDALRTANARYRQRFVAVEKACRARGLDMSALSEQDRRDLWG